MGKILITKVNPENYVCESMIRELNNEINANILQRIIK